MPGELFLPDFLRPLFLLDVEDPDFFAADRFFVVFLVAIELLMLSDVNDFRSLGPLGLANCKGYAARTRKAVVTVEDRKHDSGRLRMNEGHRE
jgi:hypothetical protein